MIPSGYYKFEILSKDLKILHKIKIGASIPRYDCTHYYGDYKGLEAYKNKKGMMYLNLHESRDIIKAHDNRKTEFVLKGNGLNFSSLYFENIQFQNLCYGYPNRNVLLSNGEKNPLFIFRNDLYIIIINDEFTEVEVFIFENCKPHASEYLQESIAGNFDDTFEDIRERSKPFFAY